MQYHYVLVGGGLQNSLVALALLHASRGARVALIERRPGLGPERTWCFHAGDIPAEAWPWLEPVVACSWESYDVSFAGRRRTVRGVFAAARFARLRAAITEQLLAAPGCALVCGGEATQVEPNAVALADGRRLEADTVIDARGPAPVAAGAGMGYAKRTGIEVALRAPCGMERPLAVDASVPQRAGYRFVSMVPLAPDRVLVEETQLGHSPVLDVAAAQRWLLGYLEEHGLHPDEVVHEQAGVLGIPWHAPQRDVARGPLVAGYQGGLFHPTTGLSFVSAVKLAVLLARLAPRPPFGPELDAWLAAHAQQARFARRLNWLMFHLIRPEERWRLARRLYELRDDRIERFHGLSTRLADRAAILFGRPGAVDEPKLSG